ncbi:MAG: TolC family protein [Planctomycetota bacterium]
MSRACRIIANTGLIWMVAVTATFSFAQTQRVQPLRSMSAALQPYEDRVLNYADETPTSPSQLLGEIDISDESWKSSMGLGKEVVEVSLSELVDVSLFSSPKIASILIQPRIGIQETVMADSEFDAASFLDARFADTNDPIGSQLITGNDATRFRDETFTSGFGFRKRTRDGGNWELSQRLGTQGNNSTFLVPNAQSTTRLELNFTQPLMRGRGKQVAQTRIILARLEAAMASDQARRQIESHLMELAEVYWSLYRHRQEYAQRLALREQALDVSKIVKPRQVVDASQRQLLKVESALVRRESGIIDSRTKILDLQTQLRALTGDAKLQNSTSIELIPIEKIRTRPSEISSRDAALVGLQERPDIAESLQQIRSLMTRVGAAKNQVLPQLDLILSGYVAGLDNRSDAFDSFTNQFTTGRPSFAGGINFDLPVANRLARARVAREQLELNRAIHRFQQTTEDALAEIEIAVRRIDQTRSTVNAQQKAVEVSRREVEFLERRLRLLPNPEESIIVLIEDLLDAQTQLAAELDGLNSALTDHVMSHLRLRREMGTLVQLEAIGTHGIWPVSLLPVEPLTSQYLDLDEFGDEDDGLIESDNWSEATR